MQDDKSVVDTGLRCIEAGHIPYRFRKPGFQIMVQSTSKPGQLQEKLTLCKQTLQPWLKIPPWRRAAYH